MANMFTSRKRFALRLAIPLVAFAILNPIFGVPNKGPIALAELIGTVVLVLGYEIVQWSRGRERP